MGVEKRIKDLTTASSITNNDYLAMDNANNLAAKKTSAMPLRNVNAIANIQNNLVANKAYAIGEQFVYQGNVYQATAAIASGATITINGNCALADSLADQITDLNQALSNLNTIDYDDVTLTVNVSNNIFLPYNQYMVIAVVPLTVGLELSTIGVSAGGTWLKTNKSQNTQVLVRIYYRHV